jgi:Tfp pilus assembly protein PilV
MKKEHSPFSGLFERCAAQAASATLTEWHTDGPLENPGGRGIHTNVSRTAATASKEHLTVEEETRQNNRVVFWQHDRVFGICC